MYAKLRLLLVLTTQNFDSRHVDPGEDPEEAYSQALASGIGSFP
jgi:hypothetical protein